MACQREEEIMLHAARQSKDETNKQPTCPSFAGEASFSRDGQPQPRPGLPEAAPRDLLL
jgi:hypothetical protein